MSEERKVEILIIHDSKYVREELNEWLERKGQCNAVVVSRFDRDYGPDDPNEEGTGVNYHQGQLVGRMIEMIKVRVVNYEFCKPD